MTNRLQWREVLLPGPVLPTAMRAILAGWAALPDQPRLVLETLATKSGLRWRIGADDDLALRRACRILVTHLPDAIVCPLLDWPTSSQPLAVASVRIRRSRQLPVGDHEHDSDATTRALLGALSSVTGREQLCLQVLLGPRLQPRIAPTSTTSQGPMAQPERQRAATSSFGCAIRIGASASTRERAHSLVSQVGGQLSRLNAPGIRVRLLRASQASLRRAANPLLWPLWLTPGSLTAVLGWPVTSDPEAKLPGVPARHPRPLAATDAHPKTGVVIGEALLPSGRLVAQGSRDALQHRHVLGPTGVGKSTLLAQIVLQDIALGRGVVVIDPKSDLVTDILARLPEERRGDVVVLDAASPRPLGLNPLQMSDPDLAADSVVAVFHSLFGDGLGPRSTDILHAACLTLARRGDGSLVMVPLLLTNPGFRCSVIGRVVKEDRFGLGAFWASFEGMSDPEREAAIRPLLNKLRQVLLRPSLRAIFGQRRPAISLDQILYQNKILLVRLRKDRIGPEAAQLLGSLLVAQLWQAMQARLSLPAEKRHPVQVVIDETQDYLRLPGSLGDALAQARGLGIGLTICHQHRSQLGRLLDDVDANTATKLCFRLAPADARAVAGLHASGVLDAADFTSLPAFELYARLLVGGNQAPWVRLATRPLPSRLRDPAVLQRASEAQHGRTLDDIERDLIALIDHTAGGYPAPSPDAAAPPPSNRPGRVRLSATVAAEPNPRPDSEGQQTSTNKTNNQKGGNSDSNRQA